MSAARHKPILIAEDYDNDLVMLQLALKKAGVANPIHVARDGDETMAYLKGESPFADRTRSPAPSILFLDLKMPKQDGYAILAWMKNKPQFDHLLVIVLTGVEQIREMSQAYQLGADSFLTKPCTEQHIQHLINYFPGYWEVSVQTPA
jgi:CheY-like chemotaxis protein